MHLDPIMSPLVAVVTVMVLLAVAARLVRQPPVVGYLLAGVAMGSPGLALITDADLLSRFGAIGVILLLFFVGLEVSPKRLGSNWRVPVAATFLQVGVTTGIVMGLGAFLDWPLHRCILIGFVISLSSTAMVLKLLQEWGELDSTAGQDVLGVLLIQDLAVIPMLIGLGLLAGEALDAHTLALQAVGAAALLGLAVWTTVRGTIALPFGRWIKQDHELQVLAALLICFGLALLSGLLQLSTALGAFVAGMVVHAAKETTWVGESLRGFRIIFIALFFVSVGMLIDLSFLREHWPVVLLLVFVAVAANNVINTLILRGLGRSWRDSLYAGALLSQIGEFSFVLAAAGLQAGVVTGFAYQMTISVIAASLIVCPAWIALVKWIIRRLEAGDVLADPAGDSYQFRGGGPIQEARQRVAEIFADEAEMDDPAENTGDKIPRAGQTVSFIEAAGGARTLRDESSASAGPKAPLHSRRP